jgi:hypothetical protein
MFTSKLIVGYEHWEYKHWIQFALDEEAVDMISQQKRARKHHSSSASSISTSSLPSILSNSNSSRRTTQETSRTSTEISKICSKSRKSVRFENNDVSPIEKVETVPLFTEIKPRTKGRLKRLKRGLKIGGKKIERPLIGILMRCGY